MHRAQRILRHVAPESTVRVSAISTASAAASLPTADLFGGRVAIITGSGQGIGAAAAKLFAKCGAKVVVTDLDAAKSDAVANEIKAEGGHAISVAGDITDPQFPDRIVKQTIESFGKLHIIINNAGYTWDGVLHKMTDKQWQAMLDCHLTAPFRLIRAAAPYMRDAAKVEMEKTGSADPRCIINISSTSGLHGNAGQANYAAAKMGIVGLTKTIAKEWGMFNVRCNTVAFGFIETRLTADRTSGASITVQGEEIKLGIPKVDPKKMAAGIPLGRPGVAEEAAGSLLMIASPYAGYITGHTLEVTGGAGI
eukprot:TRINITY_DN2442_c0_g1_i1.p1 TRINITY_DN2442_c0_g1~~TRINITY_DN2442_c0_g1_i1.p1  ORF type:complete len:309 (-),score=75.44 TRINITY_DN2442_c0_g1_i1:105-1031(-)